MIGPVDDDVRRSQDGIDVAVFVTGLGDEIALVVAADIDVIGGPYVPPDTGATGAVTTIEIITSDSAYSYTIPAGKWLVGWEVKGDTDQIVNLGTTAGGSDLGSSFDLSAGSTWVGQGNMLPTFTSQTIYFSGLEGTNNINLWLIG